MILKKYEDYSDLVNNLFTILSKELNLILPKAKIEHIGASSIPGSISKGDLDVYVGVDSSYFNLAIELIKSIGFYEKEGTFRSEELCMLVTDKFNYDVAIQLVANGSEFEDFLVFRNLLRDDHELVLKYNNIKTLAQSLSDDDYRKEKNKFIERVLRRP